MKKIYFYLIPFFLLSCSTGSYREMEATEEQLEESVGSSDLRFDLKQDKTESKTWKRSNKTANTTTLFIGDDEQLPLKGSQIAVKVDGFRARVLVDCFFYSNKEREMEGNFKMRLPQGASPYYFAFGESIYLDKSKQKDSIPFIKYDEIDFSIERIEEMRSETWSKPKVARVVQKDKASFAYGQIVRRQIDPALAEWAGADVFNCKVFPLRPNKLHRIVIGYDVNLTNLQDDWIFNFPIPEVNCPLILDFNVTDILGVNCNIYPQQNITSKNGKKTFRITNPKEKEIIIRYNSIKNIALYSPKEEIEESYFASSISTILPSSSNLQISDNAIIALDISLSSNPDKFNIWLKLAKALLSNNQNTIKRFNVLLFNIEAF